jgi:hypothetical protein
VNFCKQGTRTIDKLFTNFRQQIFFFCVEMLRHGLIIPCLLQEKEAHCEGTSKDIVRNFQLLHEGKVFVNFSVLQAPEI